MQTNYLIKITTCLFLFFATFPLHAVDSFPSLSVYQLSSTWKNQEGKTISLRQFAGKPLILAMVYTGCPNTCPLTINKLQELDKQLKKSGESNYHFVLASFDLKGDRPADLRKYMERRGLDPQQWTMLSADSDGQVRELALVLDINYKRLDGGEISHSNTITLLDAQGLVIAKIASLSEKVDQLLTAFPTKKPRSSNIPATK